MSTRLERAELLLAEGSRKQEAGGADGWLGLLYCTSTGTGLYNINTMERDLCNHHVLQSRMAITRRALTKISGPKRADFCRPLFDIHLIHVEVISVGCTLYKYVWNHFASGEPVVFTFLLLLFFFFVKLSIGGEWDFFFVSFFFSLSLMFAYVLL